MRRLIAGLLAGALFAGCSAVPSPTPVASPTASRLSNRIELERARMGAPGMLALVRRDSETLWITSGTADVNGAPLTRSTRFRIGSITKPIVAALTLMAVDDGVFSIDDEVEDLLPGVLRPNPRVTVKQLLDHTSGIFDEGNEGDPLADIERIDDPTLQTEARDLLSRYQQGEEVVLTDRVWIALAETHERYFEPGSDIHYSNVNYQVLGMILERQTGSTLPLLLDAGFVGPLGLVSTSLAPHDRSTPEMHGYAPAPDAEETLVDITDDIAWFGNGAHGGVISTPDELLAMLGATVSGDLLEPELTEQMKTPTFPAYGLGLATYKLDCGTYYGHGGSVLGTDSLALVSDDATDGVVVALNVHSDRDAGLVTLANTLLCHSEQPNGR